MEAINPDLPLSLPFHEKRFKFNAFSMMSDGTRQYDKTSSVQQTVQIYCNFTQSLINENLELIYKLSLVFQTTFAFTILNALNV